jgi:predicted porin
MKKTLIALAVLTVSGASFAQSSVTIGGLIDIAPLSMGKVTTTAKDSSTAVGVKTDRTGSPTTWATSVLTVSGTEDLGGGLKANFLLMSGAGAGTGAHNTDSTTNASDSGIGNRERSVGLSGGFGALRLGRFVPAAAAGFHAFTQTGSATLVGSAYGMSTANSSASANGLHTNSHNFERINNVVQFTSPTMSGFTANLAIANNGNDSDASAATGKADSHQTSFHIGYAAGPLSAGFGVNTLKSNVEAAAGKDATSSAFAVAAVEASSADSHLQWIGASYNLGVATLGFANIHREGSATDDEGTKTTGTDINVNVFGVTVPMGALTLRASTYSGKDKRGTGASDNVKLSGNQISAVYALSKRTAIVAATGTNEYKRDGEGSAAATRKAQATTLSVNHTF